jgi:hypothetical protein
MLIVDRGEHPGVVVAPWTIDGVLNHARDRGLHITFERTGGAYNRDPVARRLHAAQVPAAAAGPALELQIPGARRTLSIPGAWVGAHACLVAPCVREREPGGAMVGPLAGILEAIARGCGADPARPIAEVGAWLLQHTFASVGLVLDATWTVVLDAHGAQLQSAARCLAWTVPRTGLDATALDRAIADAVPFPPSPTAAGSALAERTVGGLWRKQSAPPRVPGPLARAWYAYPESCR